MRKLLYEIYNALASIVNTLTPAEPEEPETDVQNNRRVSKGGTKK